jgi:hypothetical protein
MTEIANPTSHKKYNSLQVTANFADGVSGKDKPPKQSERISEKQKS